MDKDMLIKVGGIYNDKEVKGKYYIPILIDSENDHCSCIEVAFFGYECITNEDINIAVAEIDHPFFIGFFLSKINNYFDAYLGQVDDNLLSTFIEMRLKRRKQTVSSNTKRVMKIS